MMKKTAVFVLLILCLINVCSCGLNNEDNQQEINNKPDDVITVNVITIETPYVDICFPEEYDKYVTNEVINEEPYTILFKVTQDGTELFSLVFNGQGDVLLGTLVESNDNTVIYMNIPEIDRDNDNYETYCRYQESVNCIINHLVSDNTFYIDQIVERHYSDTFSIKTSFVTLKYPIKWENEVQIEMTDDYVKFFNNGTPLFDLVFIECDGFLLGTYNDIPIYIIDYEVENDEQIVMQDDVNVILQHLMEDPDFVINL